MARESENRRCKVLLVEDNDDHALLVKHQFRTAIQSDFELTRVASLQGLFTYLEESNADVLLLDLSLPDSHISETLETVLKRFPELPIVVLTSLSDMSIASEAVQQGAQDYLVKSELTGELLLRAVRYAIERKRYALALERSNAEFRRFASTVAHEIRTPIGAVHSCLSIIKRRHASSLDEATLSVINKTEERVSGMLQLITDLLRFAHVEPESNFRRIELSEVWSDAVTILEHEIRRTGAKITSDELPAVIGDPALLRQVFQNLISNSLKYCETRPEIHISVKEECENLICSIQDNGIGIDPEQLENIFQIFRRLDGLKTISGTGIGLSLCRRIVEHHHGKIWASSNKGVGTTFHILLPKNPSLETSNDSPCG